MKVEGALAVDAPRQAVFATFRDPASLSRVASFKDVSPDGVGRFRVSVEVPTSVGIACYRFAFQVLFEDPGKTIRLVGHGTTSQHVIDVAIALTFADEGEGTRLSWEADIRLGGVIASIAQRTAPGIVAREVTGWFADLAGGRDTQAVALG